MKCTTNSSVEFTLDFGTVFFKRMHTHTNRILTHGYTITFPSSSSEQRRKIRRPSNEKQKRENEQYIGRGSMFSWRERRLYVFLINKTGDTGSGMHHPVFASNQKKKKNHWIFWRVAFLFSYTHTRIQIENVHEILSNKWIHSLVNHL